MQAKAEFKCVICGSWFYARAQKALYCSRACGLNAIRARNGKTSVKKKCTICLVEFETYKHWQKTCSKDCRNIHKLAQAREAQKKHWAKVISNDALTSPLKTRFEILKRDNFKCTYCGRGAKDGATLHVDHIYPKVKGGTDDPGNLTTACEECNLGKTDVILEKRSLNVGNKKN